MRRILFWAIEAAILTGIWFLYTDKVSKDEAAIGIASAALAAVGSESVRELNFVRFYPHARVLAEVWRIPGMVFEGCWVLLKVLVLRLSGKDLPSEVKTIPFQAGGDDSRSYARRALAILFSTLAPNSIVIGIDRAKHTMTYHQMLGTGVPLLTQKLGTER